MGKRVYVEGLRQDGLVKVISDQLSQAGFECIQHESDLAGPLVKLGAFERAQSYRPDAIVLCNLRGYGGFLVGYDMSGRRIPLVILMGGGDKDYLDARRSTEHVLRKPNLQPLPDLVRKIIGA